ncbi:protein of unknown function (plasmid) [Candidatus Methylocalor cossyra]|uniref:Transposase n=1 Tax=Candidatus Methylocalor cossyra TaxID=3108543 RepID=A0ABM9NMX9_9GAMM
MAARPSMAWRCWLSSPWDSILSRRRCSSSAIGRDRVKLLLWDRTGFWLMLKRLEADRFRWPKEAAVVELTVEQLHWLLAGIDLAAMRPHPERKYAKVG